MVSPTVENSIISIEDAVHYIKAEIDNMVRNNILPKQTLTETPYYLLDAEYLLFEASPGHEKNLETISVSDVDKVMTSFMEIYKKGVDISKIKVNREQLLLLKGLLISEG